MSWKLQFYSGVEDSILSMPPKIQARMIRLLELIERHGANLGSPHTDVKKSQKTPKKELSIAKQRQKEVQSK